VLFLLTGKVVIVEQILPIFPESSTLSAQDKSQVDMLSLTQSPGGKERLQHEIINLATSAGFPCVAFLSRVHTYWVLEFRKKKAENLNCFFEITLKLDDELFGVNLLLELDRIFPM